MASKVLKFKRLVILGVFMGIVSFSVCHASVMPQSMDGMDCQAQTFCIACPVSVISESPDLSNILIKFDNLSETPSFLPDPIRDSFYHPPR